MDTPVLFLIFNRVDTTTRVFDSIRSAKPKLLFIAADGPRPGVPEDMINCPLTRAVVDNVDWPCIVRTLFRENNLGCRPAVSSAIDWFFSKVEKGIILEDDCLPHPDFFAFCTELLQKYQDNPKVMHISGGNFQFGQKRGPDSYYFSRIPHIWGWASWRRAWQHYDVDMQDYPSFKKLPNRSTYFYNRESENYWMFYFDHVYKKAGTWDYQWTYAVMRKRGLSIIPNVNLISNIGFGNNATHASETTNPVANMPVSSLLPIVHPAEVIINEEADLFTITQAFPTPSFPKRLLKKAKSILRKML